MTPMNDARLDAAHALKRMAEVCPDVMDAVAVSRHALLGPDVAPPAPALPTVLVIDDDEIHGETLSRWLGRRGFAVVVNRSHSDGIREAIAGQWDAVLLDGADVSRITDARPDLASRVLLVTASDVEGALVKPFHPSDLLDWLRQTVA